MYCGQLDKEEKMNEYLDRSSDREGVGRCRKRYTEVEGKANHLQNCISLL